MAKGALYWRLKDEQTGKWTYKRVETYEELEVYLNVKMMHLEGEYCVKYI